MPEIASGSQIEINALFIEELKSLKESQGILDARTRGKSGGGSLERWLLGIIALAVLGLMGAFMASVRSDVQEIKTYVMAHAERLATVESDVEHLERDLEARSD